MEDHTIMILEKRLADSTTTGHLSWVNFKF